MWVAFLRLYPCTHGAYNLKLLSNLFFGKLDSLTYTEKLLHRRDAEVAQTLVQVPDRVF